MSIQTNQSISRSILHKAFLVFMLVSVASCARKITFPISEAVPAAQGKVKIKKDHNNNYAIQVTIRNLAEPERLQPSRRYYVAWIETDNNGVVNIGQLVSKSGFLSKTLKASLEAVTPYKPTRVFVSAEDDAAIQYPGMQIILRTRRF